MRISYIHDKQQVSGSAKDQTNLQRGEVDHCHQQQSEIQSEPQPNLFPPQNYNSFEMNDLLAHLVKIEERINYLLQIKDSTTWGNLAGYKKNCDQLKQSLHDYSEEKLSVEVRKLNDSIHFLEDRAEEHLTPMERVRIVRSIERFSLKDILKNVYDDYTELGGADDDNIDPAMICAKATIIRQTKNKLQASPVMVIGQETGHGEEFYNGGSCKPQGNEKALRFMKIAETEGIPIHFYIFTPGPYPDEEGPGAAQQIARNIYAMTKLRVPMISFISEGGSTGAEAIGLSDYRLMASHGYYSAVSPEEAAAIEGKVVEGSKVPKELIEVCGDRLKLTAGDNLEQGIIDRIVQEPRLGARRDNLEFFANLRTEMVQATDKVVLSSKNFSGLRTFGIRQKRRQTIVAEGIQPEIPWGLNENEIKRLLVQRSEKYLEMGKHGFSGRAEEEEGIFRLAKGKSEKVYHVLRHDIIKNYKGQIHKIFDSVSEKSPVLFKRLANPIFTLKGLFSKNKSEVPQRLITYTWSGILPESPSQMIDPLELTDTYTNPLVNSDQAISCPNAEKYGCGDLWVPYLYSALAGICETCNHHFPLEYQWYMKNIFDQGSIRHFNTQISSGNPIHYTGFTKRLRMAKNKTGWRSGNMTFHAKIEGIKIIVSMLYADFRNGTVGAAEGEKFIQACALAKRKKRPFLAYIHSTGGIRLQEGTLGIAQMSRCTMAVREYIDAGGLYLVVYDNNAFGGPVASFLGCSPYQFAIRSSRVGLASPREMRDNFGSTIAPDYHSARNALKRGHIQGVWDRREFRHNLHKALLTMGSPNLYYR